MSRAPGSSLSSPSTTTAISLMLTRFLFALKYSTSDALLAAGPPLRDLFTILIFLPSDFKNSLSLDPSLIIIIS